LVIWFSTIHLTITCVTNFNFENITLLCYNIFFKTYSTIKVQFEQNLIPQTLIQILKTLKNFKLPKWNSFGNIGTSSLPLRSPTHICWSAFVSNYILVSFSVCFCCHAPTLVVTFTPFNWNMSFKVLSYSC